MQITTTLILIFSILVHKYAFKLFDPASNPLNKYMNVLQLFLFKFNFSYRLFINLNFTDEYLFRDTFIANSLYDNQLRMLQTNVHY